ASPCSVTGIASMPPTPPLSGSFERPFEQPVAGEPAELVGEERRPRRGGQEDGVVEQARHHRGAEPPAAAPLDQVLLATALHRHPLQVVRAALPAQLDLAVE